jgi:hypothetical protein
LTAPATSTANVDMDFDEQRLHDPSDLGGRDPSKECSSCGIHRRCPATSSLTSPSPSPLTSHHSSQVVVEGAAILAVVIVDVDLIVDPGR